MQFILTGLPPTTNKSFRYGNGRMYQTQDYKDWVAFSRYEVPRKVKKLEGPVKLYVAFHVSRDRDIDSGLKCLLDGLQGRLYDNDSQVVGLDCIKVRVPKGQEKTVVDCRVFAIGDKRDNADSVENKNEENKKGTEVPF